MPDVTMPKLSDSMTDGLIVAWLCDDGSPIERGAELVEIETDKATVVYEANHAGVLRQVATAGTTVPVGAPIAVIGEPSTEPTSEPAAESAPEPAAESAAPGPRSAAPGANVSPIARRLAKDLGVEVAGIVGSGPHGRILREDVLAAAAATAPTSEPVESRPSSVPLTRVQRLVADRMVQVQRDVPAFSVSREVDMTAAVYLRTQLAAAGATPVPSVNDLVVKAAALALADHPRLNSRFGDGAVTTSDTVDIGVAVAVGDDLVVPVLRGADRLTLSQVAQGTRALVDRARAGRLSPAELDGGTFTVSNLGMHDVSSFTAVIHGGQAAILAVGAVRSVPVVRDGAVAVGQRMTLTLTCDHRLVYGAHAAAFLGRATELLQTPMAL